MVRRVRFIVALALALVAEAWQPRASSLAASLRRHHRAHHRTLVAAAAAAAAAAEAASDAEVERAVVREIIEKGEVPPGEACYVPMDDVELLRLGAPLSTGEEPEGELWHDYWLKMTVPGQTTQAYMSKLMAEAKKNANFPGFKKGQIPPYARPQMVSFTLEEAINTGMLDVLEAAGLSVLSGDNAKAEVLEDIKAMAKIFKPGTPLTFTASLRAGVKAAALETKQQGAAAAAAEPEEPEEAEEAEEAVAEAEIVEAEAAAPEANKEEEAPKPAVSSDTPKAAAAAVASSSSSSISAADVKALREASGAGMMKCKEALTECGGDAEKAAEWLRAKGLASADKKSDRATKEGLIASYIHTGARLGVMVELNCETDFVAKGDKFAELARAVAMQVAASPSVDFVKADDISEAVKQAEREAEMRSEDLAGKPDDIKAKMVEGRLGKILKQKVLMEQPYIRDPSMTVEELVKGYISTLGENIQVARFERMNLGESSADEEASE